MIIANGLYVDHEGNKIRILEVYQLEDTLLVIDMKKGTSVPYKINMAYLENLIESDLMLRVPDPLSEATFEGHLSENQQRKYDEHYAIVQEVWFHNKEDYISKRNRNKLIEKVGEEFGKNSSTIRRIVTRYLQSGMLPIALIPNYKYCGAPNRVRNSNDVKRGRPLKPIVDGHEQPIGINVTPHDQKIFRKAIEQFYLKNPSETIKGTYNKMLSKYYQGEVTGTGAIQLRKDGKYPKYPQFYYWFYKLTTIEENTKKREGQKKFEQNNRYLPSTSDFRTFGPGMRYQIDATIADVYLVSEINRKRVIGRPVVYMVVDEFSRLVVGYYAGLEGPSWLGASMAIDNIVENKKLYCQKHSIEIREDQWPNSYMPQKLLADRGEIKGKKPEALIKYFGIEIENTPPMRPDLKGIVERKFKTFNGHIKRLAPGAVEKEYRERGDRRYSLDAKLTLKEFNSIMIELILNHNTSYIEKFNYDEEMLADEVKSIPSKLWEWGKKNRRCGFKLFSRDYVRLSLMEKASAKITRRGVLFKSLHYTASIAISDSWFINRLNERIEVRYDPRNVNTIYYMTSANTYEVLRLAERDYAYKDLCFDEVKFLKELNTELQVKDETKHKEADLNTDKHIEKIVEDAKAKQPLGKIDDKNIKINRSIEKEYQRNKEQFKLDDNNKKKRSKKKKAKKDFESNYINDSLRIIRGIDDE